MEGHRHTEGLQEVQKLANSGFDNQISVLGLGSDGASFNQVQNTSLHSGNSSVSGSVVEGGSNLY